MRAGISGNRGWRYLAMPPLALAIIVGLVTFGALPPAQAAPCDAPIVNEIACENSLPGNPASEWEVSGSGSSSIQGFATDISVDQGGTIGFKVDTTAASFRLDIYRMGYYAGNGARKVGTVNPTDVRNQANCLSAPSTGLIDCGNWTLSATWNVPGDAVSGIYFARLVRTDATAGASHVVFIVRDDDGQSDLLFQTSDTTWQAYNEYGGNSLYTGSPDGRAYKVSYNRPFTTRSDAPEDWVFNAEYPMVRFLESNGYDVSYTTGIDTDRRGAELLDHRVFVSVGHDEYWSGQQRTNVEAARDAGVHLAFFSGNEVYWKTRWEPAIDGSGTPYRSLVTYKETHAHEVIDPAHPTWTGTWRDQRFSPPADGGRPENGLTGTIFRVNCCEIDMVVRAAEGDMRFWRNTRVADLTGNQTTTVGSDIVGYEWDEDLDNGFRPAGLFRVSETFGGSQQILLDEGDSFGSGSATHSMTMYRAASGALVFGAGTVQWAWALDSNHDRGSAPADSAAQQAMVNLWADMGVQPATLMPGLTAATASTDTTAPVAVITAPTDGSSVAPGSTVTVMGTATDVGGRVGGIEVSTDGGTTWHRATGRESWSYSFSAPNSGSVNIAARATDDSGNIGTPVTVTVNAGGGGGPVTCPCSIWPASATPAGTDSDAASVEVGVKFRASQAGFITALRFHKSTENTGTHTGRLWSATGTLLGTVTFTDETASGWQQATFTTPIPVTANATYVASYHAANGNYSVNSNYFASAGVTNGPLSALANGVNGGNGVYTYGGPGSFPTSTFQSENYWVDVVFDVSSSDTTAPTVTSRSPGVGATGVAVGAPATATFSEPVTAASVQMSLTPSGGSAVSGSTSYDAVSRTATFTPAAPLVFGTTYTAAVSGATDAAGNAMTAVNWSFTTAAGDTTPPSITGRSPGIGATGVAVGASVTATFDEAVSGALVSVVPSGGSAVAGVTSYNATTRTVTFDPTADLATATTYTVTVSGATDAAGNAMTAVNWSFTTATPIGCPCSIFPASTVPGTPNQSDTKAVEVGVKFQASQAGFITGIRFYKGTTNTGTHTGRLWSATGTLLGTVTFTNETASGWQQALFTAPIPVTANTTYVASYHAPIGRYAIQSNGFGSAVTNGPLTALASGTSGGNGVYRYGGAGQFPATSWNASNYYVDVVYDASSSDTTAPTVTSRSPGVGATGVAVGAPATATFSEPVTAASVQMSLTPSGGSAVSGSTSYDAVSRTATFTPAAPLVFGTTYTAAVSGATDAAGNAMTAVNWSFTTAAGDTTPPSITGRSPGIGATGVAVGASVTATFDEAVSGALVSVVPSGGSAVAGVTSYNATTRTVTFDPTADLATATTYTVTVSGATDAAGNAMTAVNWSFTTATPIGCPCSIFPATAVPAATDGDKKSVEVGVKFQAAQAGFITGIRFYKGTANTGTHTGHLWTSTGTLLGTVTFTNETASGWQQALFTTPVSVTANTTYVASYHAPIGRYSTNSNFFASSGVTNGPLTALANGVDGGNGVYRYGGSGTFPSLTYQSENYWVDVVFDVSSSDTTAPTVTSRSPGVGATGVAVGAPATATFSEPVTAASVQMSLTPSGGSAVSGSTSYDAVSRTATFTPAAPLVFGTTYTAAVSGATDAAGNTMTAVNWSFSTAATDTTSPAITGRSPAIGATGVAVGASVTATFDEAVSGAQVSLVPSGGSAVAGSTSYNAATRTVTFDPTANLAAATTYTVTVSGAIDAAGNTMSTSAWSFTTATPLGCPCSIWPPTATPAGTDNDSAAVEVGVKFRAAQDGFIRGIRFYKATENSGTHSGRLWTSAGTLLGTASFVSETASGWQQGDFTAPIPVTANTTYIASYHAPNGRYSTTPNFFGSAGVTNGPLTALADGVDGGNGVYGYGGSGTFPSSTFQSENYWVDVVYDTSSTDTTPPTIVSRAPLPGASGTSVSSPVTATFSEPVVAGTIQITLTPNGGSAVAGSTSYDAPTRTATFAPAADLVYNTTYTVNLSGVADPSGNPMTTATWTFTTGGPPPPLPTEGLGGPIGVVTSSSDPFSGYFAEILRAEGLNIFTTLDISEVDAAELTNFTTVVLGHVSVTPQQAATFTSWVQAGGNLIASRPDPDLASLLGLTSAGGTLGDAYIGVDNATGAGAGIESETMQFHGTADRYNLAGASAIATLYSSATVATQNPAVTVRDVGTNGGQAAAFTYDLARSIVYTRQGNPAWAGQERDGQNPIRSDDLYFGGSAPDWVNLDKVAIPQADEQQRLLANLIEVVNRDRMPLPRTWYFPGDERAVVVATGDDHASGGTSGRFDTYLAADPAGCSTSNWGCYRFSSYIYPSSPLSNSAASAYHGQDFEIGLHPENGCSNFTPTSLRSTYATDLADWASDYPSLPSPVSNRFHCLVWSDWASQFEVESENGMRFDVNYYYWPGSWIANRPGFMTGSGMPQRFAGLDGTMVDVYQAATQMTDESGQSYPFTPNTLLDRALGADGYYGYFVANMHTDDPSTQQDTALLSSAIAHGVPVVSARDALEFIDGRNASSFQSLSWASNTLNFTVVVGTGAHNLTAMLPTAGPNGTVLSGITRGGSGVPYQVSTIKGIEYAMFPAAAGAHAATYAAPGGGPQVLSSSFVDESFDGTSVSWTTDQPTSGTILLGSSPAKLSTAIASGGAAGEHSVEVPDLEPGGTYYYRIVSEGTGGTTTTWPPRSQPPDTIVIPEADTEAPTIDGLGIAPQADGTALLTWTTDETADGKVVIRNLDDGDVDEAIGVGGLTEHTVVVTGLEPDGRYRAEVTTTDAAGNASRTSRVFMASGAGVAEYMAASQRVGVLAGTRIDEDASGGGHIRLADGSDSGTFTSRILDARQMAAWDSARWNTTGDVQVVVSVRGGVSEEPDSSWSEWQVVDRSGGSIDIDSRFVQYRIEFRGGTGSVDAVRITHVGGFASAHGEHHGDDANPAAGFRPLKPVGVHLSLD